MPKPETGLPNYSKTLTGNLGGEAEKMATLRVADSRIVAYSPEWAGDGFVLKRAIPGNFTLWISPGYWGYRIVAIEGKDATKLSPHEQLRLFKTLAEPMHLVVRLKSGQPQEVEAVTHVD